MVAKVGAKCVMALNARSSVIKPGNCCSQTSHVTGRSGLADKPQKSRHPHRSVAALSAVLLAARAAAPLDTPWLQPGE